ncbi:MAG: RNA-binding protein [Hespellia sp.]|nr:RNA-binding protein [Hespellia sp.]
MANEQNNSLLTSSVLTLDSDTVLETPQSKADIIWHEIQNAHRTKKILTGMLGGIEKMENGSLIAIVYYKDFRCVIPVGEMMIHLVQDEAHDYGDLSLRQNKVLNNMLGCEIDFIVKGLDSKSRSIVASRKEAMQKKRQIFYLEKDASGNSKVHKDRVVQARIIAVAEKVVRAEVFGVETSILARDLSFDWLGDARERFHVGDNILVRILSVQAEDPEHISLRADVKSVDGNASKENMAKCKVQGKYAGTVEDIHKGTVFVRLSIGVNAIAHSCYDNRTPGKKDNVSFVVTHIDEERNVAVGIITRIIKQNI